MLPYEVIVSTARRLHKPVGVIDKDYALEWLLYGIYHPNSPVRDLLVFKGGTAIRKIFFPSTWRFSEDLDFSITEGSDPQTIVSRFPAIYDILRDEVGMEYTGKVTIPPRGKVVFGELHFVGPINHKNIIKFSASIIEKMVDPIEKHYVTTSYDDLPKFEINSYSLNEVLAEKIRSMMQRSKVRDYYDVWRMLKEQNFNIDLIGKMVLQKCIINNITYDPSIIHSTSRIAGIKAHWESDLGRLVETLPDLDIVLVELTTILNFLPQSDKSK